MIRQTSVFLLWLPRARRVDLVRRTSRCRFCAQRDTRSGLRRSAQVVAGVGNRRWRVTPRSNGRRQDRKITPNGRAACWGSGWTSRSRTIRRHFSGELEDTERGTDPPVNRRDSIHESRSASVCQSDGQTTRESRDGRSRSLLGKCCHTRASESRSRCRRRRRCACGQLRCASSVQRANGRGHEAERLASVRKNSR